MSARWAAQAPHYPKPGKVTMSDRDLDARLSSIDAKLGSLGTTVDHVHSVARGTSHAIDAVERNLGRQLNMLNDAQRRTSDAVESLHQAFTDFVEQDRRDKQRLFAHAALLTVRSEIETKYGQYEDVRRNVHGMLLALDGGLALDATMQLIAETQSINAPSYWLASALNALAAWIRDDRSAAERALLHAGSRSRGKTALFFGLLNARFERFDATDRWFRVYLNDQNPEKLSREFTVVLHAAMLGLLGDTTYERVGRQCQAWFERLSAREDIVAQQVARWRTEITRRCEPASGAAETALTRQCPVLAGVSPEWPRITVLYRQATAFERMKDVLSDELDLPRSDQSAWQTRIDDILHDLQTIHEPGEAELRQQEAHYQRIIRYEGDIAAADRAKAAEAPLDEPLVDLLTFLTNAASHPPLDAPPETTQLALHLASPWISQATADIVAETRSLSAAPVTVEIDQWRGQLGAESAEALAGTFTEMVDGRTRKDMARERFAWPRLIAGIAAVVALGIMLLELFANSTFQPWRVGAPAALAAVFLLVAIMMHRRIPRRVGEAKQRGEQRKARGLATLHDAEADRERLLAACNARISEADRLDEFVRSIALPELRHGVPGQQSGKGVPSADPSVEGIVTSSRSRGLGRPQTPFKLAEWSLEPGGTDKG
jgi:hypothetical protein